MSNKRHEMKDTELLNALMQKQDGRWDRNESNWVRREERQDGTNEATGWGECARETE